mmetsp:Transcript_56682/g.149106  ORF Transcript_56682/g.149106 Transcript_56682/m.149106 type:complete len:243 (-) Transcript_56682:909-1637(-)
MISSHWSSSSPGCSGELGSGAILVQRAAMALRAGDVSSSALEFSVFSLAPDASAEAALSAASRAAPTSGTPCVIAWALPIVRLLRCWNALGCPGGDVGVGASDAFCSSSFRSSVHSTGVPASMRSRVAKKAECSSPPTAHDARLARSRSRFRFVVSATCCCKKALFRAFQSPLPLKQLYSCFQNRMASIQYWFQASRTGSARPGQAPVDTSTTSWMQVRTTVWTSKLCTYSFVHCGLPRRYL